MGSKRRVWPLPKALSSHWPRASECGISPHLINPSLAKAVSRWQTARLIHLRLRYPSLSWLNHGLAKSGILEMHTAEHNKLNDLVNKCCRLQSEADKIIAELESFADMQASDKDKENPIYEYNSAEDANQLRKDRIEMAIVYLQSVSCQSEQAAEACNSALLY